MKKWNAQRLRALETIVFNNATQALVAYDDAPVCILVLGDLNFAGVAIEESPSSSILVAWIRKGHSKAI
jgi:hypothetical protein